MSTLVLPQPAELFGSKDFELQLAAASPQGEQQQQQEDADTMDTTTTSSSSRSPSPVVDNDENDNDRAFMEGEMTEQMIDDELGLVDEEEATDENSPMAEPLGDATTCETDLAEIPPAVGEEEEKRFGGINNLMNTCYMASALQMMASLESFVQILRERSPRQNPPLRDALLDLWDRLERGETVRPQELKRVIDERSCLFEGNEQQDAHEFLTTLLDLLDEDYKDKEEEKETSPDAEAEETIVEEEKLAAVEETKVNDEEDAGDMDIDDEEETPSKRMKTCSSYSELNVHQIEQLLHGSMPSSREGMIMPAPQTAMNCRLVGGRMNPTENGSFWSPQRAPTAVEPTLHDESSRTEQPNSPSQATSVAQVRQTQPAAVVPNAETQTKQVRFASPVDECFTTKVRVRLTCDSCKYTRTHDETYQHWSLEMSGDCSVDECLRRFFASERREIKCEKCFGESATQTSQITNLPQMLLLHFKRFVVKVSEDYSSISYEKNSSSVAFDQSFSTEEDLQDYAAADSAITPGARYRLRSVVNHHGSSVSFGHYTADAKRTVSQDGDRDWHRFNDSFVSKISEQQAVQESSRSAYLVMYELE